MDVERPAGRSLWGDARRRLLRNKAAVAAVVILLLIALLACFSAPLLRRSTFDKVYWDAHHGAAGRGRPATCSAPTPTGATCCRARSMAGSISLMVGLVATVGQPR